MELHSPVVAKKLWNVLRITFFMIRKKGLISKRKMIMDMNLMMKKGKILRKSLSNIISFHHHHHHHHHHHNSKTMAQYYEFSCSNSPNPVFFHIPKRSNNKHHHFNFPCIQSPQVLEEEEESDPQFSSEQLHLDYDNEVVENGEIVANKAVVSVPKTPEYTFNIRLDGSSDFAPGEKKSPLLSPFSVRVSNFSALDESDEIGNYGQVDDQAEDFIRRFYEQLRIQSRMQLLHYQDLS